MRVSVFGSGYVGLVTAACFAEVGNNVHCVDIDANRVGRLNQGECPIFEPGLERMLKENLAAGRITFSTSAEQAVKFGEVIFIAVGTPPQEDGSVDMQYVESVASSIGKNISDYTVVVNKSTVPVGTADRVKRIINDQLSARGVSVSFDVVSNPEFLKEGSAIQDFMKADRIIVGAETEKAAKVMRNLYAPTNRSHDKLMIMDVKSAELTKYAANAMLATKISFMNEMSRIAEATGADIEKVRLGIGSDNRIGYSFIYPGCGYGGSCFPKDVLAASHTAKTAGEESHILSAVHTVNEQQKSRLLKKIDEFYSGNIKGKTFALWGLSFKPNTDDIRDAASRVILEGLAERGARIQAYDPKAMPAIAEKYQDCAALTLCESAASATIGADALIVVTEWLQFRSPDFIALRQDLKDKVIFDGRNLFDPEYLREKGFSYFSIGRKAVLQGESVLECETETV